MKKTVFFAMLCVCALAATGLTACSNNDEEGARDVLAAFNNSGCKPSGDADETRSEADDTAAEHFDLFGQCHIEYESTDDGYLILRHINAVFNCASTLSASVVADGNIIYVTEQYTSVAANCVCPFDLTMKIGPLDPSTYNIHICRAPAEGGTRTEDTHFTVNHHPGNKGEVHFNHDEAVGELFISADEGNDEAGKVHYAYCYEAQEQLITDDDSHTVTHINFDCGIKNSDVITHLGFDFGENGAVKHFSDLKTGDCFDVSQLHAYVTYRSSSIEYVLRQGDILSGQIQITACEAKNERRCYTLLLKDVTFPSMDNARIYVINGKITYEQY